MGKREAVVRGKQCNNDDIWELPQFASDLYLDAEEQRKTAQHMREGIRECREAGYTWEEIALLVGLPRRVVYRQYMSGKEIWVGRGTYRKE